MSSPLSKLSGPAAAGLAEAIRQGSFVAPYSAIALRRYAQETDCSEIATELQQLSASGMEAAHLAYVLDVISAERSRNHPVESFVELVWSGPESAQAGTRDTGVVVRGMFANARQSVLIAGYSVYQGKRIFRQLADRMDARPELRVRMFLNITRNYQDGRSEAELLALFARAFLENDWPGRRTPVVFYDPRGLSMESGPRAALHAKCVVVDDEEALITSANFTEAAQERNIEAGVLVRIPSLAMSLREQFDTLVKTSQLRRVPGIG
jgi:phosphatidylserine/phosphatidylglycerophosphate/cardiolipin synthase-like enzyme